MDKLHFVYLLQAGVAILSPHMHTTWEEPFSAALYTTSWLRKPQFFHNVDASAFPPLDKGSWVALWDESFDSIFPTKVQKGI